MSEFNVGIALILAAILTPNVCHGQGEPALDFEVAAVRHSEPRDGREETSTVGERIGGPGTADPGRIMFLRVPLSRIMAYAFDLAPKQISGPDWIRTERYDIAANIPPGSTEQQVKRMLQNLLAERLGLTFHSEAVVVSGYELVLLGGTRLLKETDPNAPVSTPQASDQITSDPDGFPVLPPGVHSGMTFHSGHVRFRFNDVPMTELAQWLGARLPAEMVREGGGIRIKSSFVVDKTGLTGHYDFTLDYPGSPFALPPQLPDVLNSIQSALKKQLGVKLVEAKVPQEVLIIEKVQKMPAEN